jgi:hypothetical protein
MRMPSLITHCAVAVATLGAAQTAVPVVLADATSYGLEAVSDSQFGATAFSGYGIDTPPVTFLTKDFRHWYGVDTVSPSHAGRFGEVREFLTSDNQAARRVEAFRPVTPPGRSIDMNRSKNAGSQRAKGDTRSPTWACQRLR